MGNRQSYKKIAKNATSLAIVFVMMAVIAIRRDGMLFGYRMIEDKAHRATRRRQYYGQHLAIRP